MTLLEETIQRISTARHAEDLFGSGDLSSLKKVRTAINLLVHPDKLAGTTYEGNDEIFRTLERFWVEAQKKIELGVYGQRVTLAPPKSPAPSVAGQVLKFGNIEYTISLLLTQGDLADLYLAKESKYGMPVLLKIVRHAGDSDLLENEAAILGEIFPASKRQEKYYRYLPRLITSFSIPGGKKGTKRRVNVFQYVPGYHSMADTFAALGPLDFRDVTWMFKRTLAILGFLHSQLHIIHGAVLPPHILIHPGNPDGSDNPLTHGALLIDWSYSVKQSGDPIKAISSDHADYYPPEILAKRQPSPATDIYMAAKCAVKMMGGNVAMDTLPDTVPSPIRAFLKGCLIPNMHRRPDDAWTVLEGYNDLLKRVVGPRKYRHLVIPTKPHHQ